MPVISSNGLTVDYEVAYPTLSLDLSYRLPEALGGHSFDIGRVALSLQHPRMEVPVSLYPLTGSVRFEMDPNNGSFTFFGDMKIFDTAFQVGPGGAVYLTPFRVPDRSPADQKVDGAALQASINAAPPDRRGSGRGPQHFARDPATQRALRQVFEFAGAPTFIDDMLAQAKRLGEAAGLARRARHAAGAAEPGDGDDPDGPNEPDIPPIELTDSAVIAIALNPEGGFLADLSGAAGLYFGTDSGDWGVFGSVAVGLGVVESISVGFAACFYFPEGGKSALDNFGGWNFFVAVSGGEGFAAAFTVYWPEDGVLQISNNWPCGFGFTVGIGVGAPVNGFAGNAYTFLDQKAPRAADSGGHAAMA